MDRQLTMAATHRSGSAPRAIARRTTSAERFARWAGALYAGVAIVGFGLTGLDDPMATSGHQLAFLEVNPLHNLLHLLVGLGLLVGGSAGPGPARTLTLLTAASFGVAGLFGVALVGTDANVLALNHADNLVHLATAAIATACVLTSPTERGTRS